MNVSRERDKGENLLRNGYCWVGHGRGKYFLQVFQGSGIGKMEDNLMVGCGREPLYRRARSGLVGLGRA